MASKQAICSEALSNAVSRQSVMNYAGIFAGFMAKGIPEDAIKPRENVFTYNAWIALGRQVRKGEHGVKCVTFIPCSKTDKRTGEKESFRRPWTTTVFHVTQTEPMKDATRDTDGESYADSEGGL
jgi:antirestriction protein ArdC